MIDSLFKIFNNLEISWIDTSTEIVKSKAFNELLSIFPNLKDVFQEGRDKDEDEFQRTIRHIFRLFKIFFLIKSGELFHDTLSPESSSLIREKLLKIHSQNELIIPIILIYHDIGRLDNKKEHPFYSYLLISSRNMLEPFKLSDDEKLLINKVIQYHLLFATIYTGESTFYGIYSLLNDPEFNKLLTNKEIVNKFIDLLEIFTYIDILGYSYARIYDHYTNYYDEINIKLKNILNLWPNKEKALGKAKEYSQEWIEWRIAGALRIFQYVNTKPYLTKEFYFEKIKDSVNMDVKEFNDSFKWDAIKVNYLVNTTKIQVKYGLAILMLLAFGKFFRGPISKNEKISNNLIIFWALLSKEITKRSFNKNDRLWNVHFMGLPNWWKWDRKFKNELNYESLQYIINNSTQELDNIKKEFNLYLDFTSIFI
ncbi:MAG: hypothetical protein Lokiarch_28710 [Candidatus Lokiarchaeum sp. GC14_75]|nr:MAG: hypothetical protein Lokiarch_28710 [Candidatus Lokiarchaeum sp. GC14_75]